MPELVIPYRPRSVFKPYHNRTQRWACIVAHRRCGKTVACIVDLIKRAITGPNDGRYSYVAPLLSQGKEIAWTYIKHYAEPLITDTNETELRVTLRNGAVIRIHGADNPDRLRGSYLNGIVLDEYAQMRASVWGEVIRPMLADREGWATFIGTPKGHNAFYEIMYGSEVSPSGRLGAVHNPEWFSGTYRASETDCLSKQELADMRQTMTQEQYEQEAECSFEAAIRGAYYGKELDDAGRNGRITTEVAYEPGLPVHTAWDLGIGDATAIWFWQINGPNLAIIDYYESHGQGLQHYCEVLQSKPYEYGDDWVPHDARVRELGTGRTRVEVLAGFRRKPRLVPAHRVMDGIQAARLSLGRCYFHADNCRRGIEALKQYHAEFDEKMNTFKDAPHHDWTSHAADAFRYLCLAWREVQPSAFPSDPLKELLRKKTLGEWIQEYDDKKDLEFE